MASRDSGKPNVVFILSDDQGIWALGCAGNSEIRTPVLDQLATTGILFDNFFCASPVCSPARATLLTGRIPSQHGVHDFIAGEGNFGENAIEYLEGQTGYTEILAKHGYHCGLSGKWHLGDSGKPQKGFKHWFVHQRGGGAYYNAPMVRDGEPIDEPGYITDRITDDALDFINRSQRDDKPFYLSVHYTAPHFPWTNSHPQEIVDSYQDCAFESCPQEPIHPWARRHHRFDEFRKYWRENLMGYFAAVTAMDMNIGRILDRLSRLDLTKNTLIVFTSDNGYNCGHHGIWGKGNGTFPMNMYESSVKVPTIVSMPGRIPSCRCDALVSAYDFMPTLLDFLSFDNPEADKLPGRSFLTALQGKTMPEDRGLVVYDEYGPTRMIRTRDWKYVHRYPYGPRELYNLSEDPHERINLVDDQEFREIKEKLKWDLDEWFVSYVDPAFDGTLEPVRALGQLYPCGPASRGKTAFAQEPAPYPAYMKALKQGNS